MEPGNQFGSFLKWAAELGISDSSNRSIVHESLDNCCLGHSLAISKFPEAGDRGLAAVRDLRKGELIFRVPKSALISSQILLEDDENLSLAFKIHPSLSSTQVNEAILNTQRAISKVQFEWKQAVDLLHHLKLKSQLRTLRAWIWVSSTISSRTLHVPWDDAGCLCPVGDFFNYAAPGEELPYFDDARTHSNSSMENGLDMVNAGSKQSLECAVHRLIDAGYEEDVAEYCFYARKGYKKGEQVLLSYGMYTNLELVEHYGFLLDYNPNDKVPLYLQPEILSSISWPLDSMYISRNGQPSFALLSALRLHLTPRRHLKSRSIQRVAYSGSQISADNEICVMNFIASNCRKMLMNLPTPLEDDIVLLNTIDGKLEMESDFALGFCNQIGAEGSEILGSKNIAKIERWKLAVQWRIRYKTILIDCINHCGVVIQSLSIN